MIPVARLHAPERLYVFDAELVAVLDADTVRLRLDQGCKGSQVEDVRLAHVDAAEIHLPDGKRAKEALEAHLAGRKLRVQTFKNSAGSDVRSFARYVGHLWVMGVPGTVADWLVLNGLAAPAEG